MAQVGGRCRCVTGRLKGCHWSFERTFQCYSSFERTFKCHLGCSNVILAVVLVASRFVSDGCHWSFQRTSECHLACLNGLSSQHQGVSRKGAIGRLQGRSNTTGRLKGRLNATGRLKARFNVILAAIREASRPLLRWGQIGSQTWPRQGLTSFCFGKLYGIITYHVRICAQRLP